jgi:hypothetical protein
VPDGEILDGSKFVKCVDGICKVGFDRFSLNRSKRAFGVFTLTISEIFIPTQSMAISVTTSTRIRKPTGNPSGF